MDIKAEKLSIIQQLLKVEDELLLEAIQKLLDYDLKKEAIEVRKDFWDEPKGIDKNCATATEERSRHTSRRGYGGV